MRRRAVAAGLAAVVLGGGLSAASTASTSVASSTASYRTVTVTGATVRSLGYTTAAGTITAVQVRLRGTGLLTTTVRARYGSSAQVVCSPVTVVSIVNALLGIGERSYSCVGFAEDAQRPRALTITAS